jgi:hypothetical protein
LNNISLDALVKPKRRDRGLVRSALHYLETDLRDVVATKLELLTDVGRRHKIAPNPLHAITVADVPELDQSRAAAAGSRVINL